MRSVVIYALIYSVGMRFFELWLSRRNARILEPRGARFFRDDGFTLMAAVQIAWIVLIGYEEWKIGPRALPESVLMGATIAFGIGEFTRFACMLTLKEFWNVRVVRVVGAPLVRSGLYRFIRHPNYTAMLIMFVSLPLALGLYIAPLTLFPWQIWAFARRLRVENYALALR